MKHEITRQTQKSSIVAYSAQHMKASRMLQSGYSSKPIVHYVRTILYVIYMHFDSVYQMNAL